MIKEIKNVKKHRHYLKYTVVYENEQYYRELDLQHHRVLQGDLENEYNYILFNNIEVEIVSDEEN